MRGTLNLYTDSSVMGDFYVAGSQTGGSRPVRKRSLLGPAMVGWVGWPEEGSPVTKPTIVGQAYLGDQHGPQAAETKAALHGLQAVLNYVACGDPKPEKVVLHLDNSWVARALKGELRPAKLRNHVGVTRAAIRQLEQLGIAVEVTWVPRAHQAHKKAHALSKAAWQQLFWDTSWRPE